MSNNEKNSVFARIASLRKNILLSASDPFAAFNNRLHSPLTILALVEKSQITETAKYEARRQYIVSLATAFEIFWRDVARDLLDSPLTCRNNLKKVKDIKFSINEILHINKNKISVGEIISAVYVFNSIEIVNSIVSDILGFDLFLNFSKCKFNLLFKTTEKETSLFKGSGESVLSSSGLSVGKCFEIRHDTVHNTGLAFKMSPEDVIGIHTGMYLFNSSLLGYIKSRSQEIKPESQPKKVQSAKDPKVPFPFFVLKNGSKIKANNQQGEYIVGDGIFSL